jgi:hypothetical protein
LLELPQLLNAYWQTSSRVDATIDFTVRNRSWIPAVVETIQGHVAWPDGVVTSFEAKRVEQLVSGATGTNFSRLVQWTTSPDTLTWFGEPGKRLALLSPNVSLTVFGPIPTFAS